MTEEKAKYAVSALDNLMFAFYVRENDEAGYILVPAMLDIFHKAEKELSAYKKIVTEAQETNNWLIRTDREGTAHQRLLARALEELDKVTNR